MLALNDVYVSYPYYERQTSTSYRVFSIAGAAGLLLFAFLEHRELRGESILAFSTITALNLWFTARVLAHKLALRSGALRFGAFPITKWIIAKNLTVWDWCLAMSNTLGFLADGHALWAVDTGAGLLGALDLADWAFALYVADGVLRFPAC